MAYPAYCQRDTEHLLSVFNKVAEKASTYISQHYTYEKKVINFVKPEELKKIIDFTLPKEGTPITESGESIELFIDQILEYSVRTGSPRYFNQLWSGTDVASIIGEWITAFTNSSTYTYEVAPVYSLMEMQVIDRLNEIVGFKQGDGVLCPGGAIANLMGILCARDHAFPDTKMNPNPTKPLVGFTSAHSHYTIKRSTWMMGLGLNGTINVSVDKDGRMDPAALDAAITKAKEEGLQPFFVNATAGSTVLGVFEDFNAIADICEKHKLWLHIDAALGGSVLFSEKHKHNMAGVERADSVAWCLHKMLGINQQCAAILTKEANVLKRVNASNADYLFHFDDTRPYDLGEKTLNCGRRQDSLKIWLSWKVHGDKGYEERINRNFANRDYFVEQLKKRSDSFELLYQPTCNQVCFYHLPKCIRGQERTKERDEICGKFVPILRRRIQVAGGLLVNYNPLSASAPNFEFLPNFWRIVFSNPEQSAKDLDFVLDEMERLGGDLTLDDIKE